MGRKRIGARLLFGAATSTLVACAAIVGINDRIPIEVENEGGVDGTAIDVSIDSGECPSETTCTKVPAGWKLIALQRKRRDTCADGFGEPRDLDLFDTDCTCKCNQVSPPRCAGDPVQLRSYPNNACSGSIATPSYPGDGGCFQGTFTPNNPGSVRVLSFPTAATCNGADAAPSPLLGGRACAATGPSCTGGVCARTIDKNEACIIHDGDEACPAEYSDRVKGGQSPADTRSCGPCTCTSSPPTNCDDDQLSLFRDTSCTKDRVDVSPACTVLDAGTFRSFRFKSAALVGCVPTSPPVLLDGGITFGTAVTVCCRRRDGGSGG